MRTPRLFALLALLLIAGAVSACSSSPPETDPIDDFVAEQCATFEATTPGYYELAESTEILSDSTSTLEERLSAARGTLDLQSDRATLGPYTCDGELWQKILGESAVAHTEDVPGLADVISETCAYGCKSRTEILQLGSLIDSQHPRPTE